MSWLSSTLHLDNLPTRNRLEPEDDNDDKRYERREVVAEWRVPLHGKVYRIEFEHGTTSGKRLIWVDGQEVLRRDWMFKLVGEDFFMLGNVRCIIRVDPVPGFKYDYLLFVDGKPLKQFTEKQAKALKSWTTVVNHTEYRVTLEKDTLNVFLNGLMREEIAEFVDGGTDTTFTENGITFILGVRTSGNKRDGIVHTLFVNGAAIPESKID